MKLKLEKLSGGGREGSYIYHYVSNHKYNSHYNKVAVLKNKFVSLILGGRGGLGNMRKRPYVLHIPPGSRFWGSFLVHCDPRSKDNENHIRLVVLRNKFLWVIIFKSFSKVLEAKKCADSSLGTDPFKNNLVPFKRCWTKKINILAGFSCEYNWEICTDNNMD